MDNCICCGKNDWRLKHRLPAFLFGKTAKIFVCRVCGLGRTDPAPTTNSEYYEKNEKYDSLFMKNKNLYMKFAHDLLSLIGTRMIYAEKRLLDVGCGGGFLVEAAIENGFNATGIEYNQDIVSWAKKRGVPVEQGDLKSKLKDSDKYDVVVLSAILEHMSDPASLLTDCKKILNPGGIILVSQASFDGLLPRLFSWGWYALQPREHYWHFTPKSLNKLTDVCNLQMLQLQRNTLYHHYYTSGGVKNIVGRNLATILARLGNMFQRGDSFDCILAAKITSEKL